MSLLDVVLVWPTLNECWWHSTLRCEPMGSCKEPVVERWHRIPESRYSGKGRWKFDPFGPDHVAYCAKHCFEGPVRLEVYAKIRINVSYVHERHAKFWTMESVTPG